MPRYRLRTPNGADLGPFQSATPNWGEGNRIHRGTRSDLIVTRLVPAEAGDGVDGYLIVETAGSAPAQT